VLPGRAAARLVEVAVDALAYHAALALELADQGGRRQARALPQRCGRQRAVPRAAQQLRARPCTACSMTEPCGHASWRYCIQPDTMALEHHEDHKCALTCNRMHSSCSMSSTSDSSVAMQEQQACSCGRAWMHDEDMQCCKQATGQTS